MSYLLVTAANCVADRGLLLAFQARDQISSGNGAVAHAVPAQARQRHGILLTWLICR